MNTGLHVNNILGVGTARHVHSLLQSPHDLDIVGTSQQIAHVQLQCSKKLYYNCINSLCCGELPHVPKKTLTANSISNKNNSKIKFLN